MISFFLALIFSLSPAQAIVDVHVHTESVAKPGEPGHVTHILQSMKDAKIEKSFLLSDGYYANQKTLARTPIENDHVAKLTKTYPDKFIGFCGVHILDPNGPKEVRRCAEQLGLKGLKLNPIAQGATIPEVWPVDLTNPEHLKHLSSIFAVAQELDLIVLIDTALFSEMAAVNLFRLVDANFYDMRIIFAHALYTNFRLLNFFAEIYSTYPPGTSRRVFLDLSANLEAAENGRFPELDIWKKSIKAFGMKYVLFASDYPGYMPKDELRRIRKYFSLIDADLILNKNISTLLMPPPSKGRGLKRMSDETFKKMYRDFSRRNRT